MLAERNWLPSELCLLSALFMPESSFSLRAQSGSTPKNEGSSH